MSPMKKLIIIGALIVSALMISGCGSSTPNEKGSNNHQAAGWLPAGHMNAAKANQNSCTECHGSDFSGGISGVSCSQCHLGGVDSVHPVEWGTNIISLHQDYATVHGTSSCANAFCHGTDLLGVANSGPSCDTCHPLP
jgi:hypothetical protein